MKIYSTPTSPFCLRVKLALKCKNILNKNISFEEIDLKNPPASLLKINPKGSVPTLEIEEGNGFAESMVIVEYFDSLEGDGPKLFGDNAIENAKIKFLLEQLTEKVIVPMRSCIIARGNKVAERRALAKIPEALHNLNKLLEKRNTPFFGGSSLNAADIHIAPFIIYYISANYLNNKYPMPEVNSKATEYFHNIKNHPAIKAVIPAFNQCNEIIRQRYFIIPDNIKYIKESSREIIEDIDSELIKLNQKIASCNKNNLIYSWKKDKNEQGYFIHTTFNFKSYEEALKAIQDICEVQESSDHHSHFILENYSQLKVEVCTHKPKWGVTAMDFAFAETLSKAILN